MTSTSNNWKRKFLGLFALELLLVSVFMLELNVAVVGVNSHLLELKWSANVPQADFIQPVIGDINGDGEMEVVMSTYGHVVALNGTDGSELWRHSPEVNRPHHRAITLADLTNDGVPEILAVTGQGRVIALFGNGTLYWQSPGVGGENWCDFPVTAYDIDGDGYPTIYSAREDITVPYNGRLTALNHNGEVLCSTFIFHPCTGGPTVADYDHDGVFEVYMGDRNTDEGKGMRSWWASNLTSRWNQTDFSSSSAMPVLIDVNGDGLLEVIAMRVVNKGLAVLDASDGSIIQRDLGLPSHATPTVYDVDLDGRLEVILSSPRDCPEGFVVWDLVRRKKDEDISLPYNCTWPPTVGDVDGDGVMEIIAATGNERDDEDYDIFIYNSTYHLIDRVPVEGAGCLSGARVQDIDGDGLNEVVVAGCNGKVLAYDTVAPTPSPRPRTEVQYYSEYRRGAAEYVEPPGPYEPALLNEYPSNSSTGLPLNPTLSVRAHDFQHDPMTVVFKTNASGTWEEIGSYSGGNGVYTQTTTNMDKYCETYFWTVNATDTTGNSTIEMYSFTTVCKIHLESVEDNGETLNLGYMIFEGTAYTLPNDILKPAGTYVVSYVADGYVLDHWETSGNVSFSSSEVTVIGNGNITAVYKAGWHFDLGTVSSPVAENYVGVNETTLYDLSSGYGWVDAAGLESRDRGSPDDLRRDFVCSRNDATFCLDLANGYYTVTLIIGDVAYTQDMIDVYAEGVLVVDDFTVFKGTFEEVSFAVDVADGQLNLRFHSDGGSSTYWVCNAIKMEPATVYIVHLESVEDTGETSNLGTIIFDGGSYTLPYDIYKPAGTYQVSFTADGYVLDHWETSVNVSTSGSAVTVSGDGTLRAVYKIPPPGWYFDLGTSSSPVASDYVGVNTTTLYDLGAGYGWVDASSLDSRDRGSPDDLRRDFVCSSNDATFCVDLANGYYTVTLIIGDVAYTQDMIDVYAEDILVVNDLTALKGTFQEILFTVNVADGQLNLRFHNDGGSSTHWVCNAIKVETPSTLYTVHLESVEDTGDTSNLGLIVFAGQSYTLPADLPKPEGTYEISYTTALGYAFDHWETSGNVSISGSTVTVTGDGNLTAVYKAVEGWYFDLGTPSSPVESGYIGVNETTLYAASLGYGWVDASSLDSRDRGAPDDLKRDLICSGQDATFCFDAPDGDYVVTLIIGDNSYTQDMIDVYAEDFLVIDDLTAPKGTFQEISFTVTVADGQLNLRFHNDGGSSTHWVCNAITIEPAS